MMDSSSGNHGAYVENDETDDQPVLTDGDEESSVVVEQTIETMERVHLCMHPVHKHSFAPVTFLISGSMRKCSGCHGRLKSVLFNSTTPNPLASASNNGDQVVRCMACYAYAHRSCALNASPENDLWKEPCPVNSALTSSTIASAPNNNNEEAERKLASTVSPTSTANDKQQYSENTTSITSPSSLSSSLNQSVSEKENNLSCTERIQDSPSSTMEALEDKSTIPVTTKCNTKREQWSTDKEDPTMGSSEKEYSDEEETSTMITLNPPPKSILERLSSSTSSLLGLASGVGAQTPSHPEATDAEEGISKEEDEVTVEMSSNNTDDGEDEEGNQIIKNIPGCGGGGDDDDDDEDIMLWTPDGPPPHWASNSSLLEGFSEAKLQQQELSGKDDNAIDKTHIESSSEPLDHKSHPFASVSRALQENVLAYFHRTQSQNEELMCVNQEAKEPIAEAKSVCCDDNDDNENNNGNNISVDKAGAAPVGPSVSSPPRQQVVAAAAVDEGGQQQHQRIIRTTKSEDSVESSTTSCAAVTTAATEDVDVKSLLTEVSPPIPLGKTEKPSVTKLASDGLNAVRESRKAKKKLGVAAVAGGVAGGAAGLLLAGPAGAVIGAKCGQTVGMLGVILEGSVSVGVFVAGVAAASYTAQQIQLKEEKRIIALGEDGTKRKVLLVRPNISVDPIWEELTADAIRSSPTNSTRKTFGIIPNTEGRQVALAQKERHQRDYDIVETDEYEIPTEDKVLLLVSRSLNDKYSLPGHVYRCLIQHYIDRCHQREKEKEDIDIAEKQSHEVEETELLDVSEIKQKRLMDNDQSEASAIVCRDRRRDTHGVIKYVTATLLEARPGFASYPTITEMSASAVEGLVFGELYDSVFEEIMEETEHVDQVLIDKIHAFELKQTFDARNFSQPAVGAIKMLTSAHSAVDKLRHCVNFLELISEHFAGAITADSLLKMVCEHIIAAKVPHINAEIGFLEEFARDEQLLRGREGYALVTIQASLHFLNSCHDFQSDIFDQEDEE